ncbi:MAG: 2-amino-4-hydroxy-6-hydroxymethyldihydropteridine diphosphokinase [Rubellimicrobium sp.]|nr:2-amino-4-hydroxy-6-hydroxymethyldihydropteridine diphosphokinase [Rubellimicrobium sp.]
MPQPHPDGYAAHGALVALGANLPSRIGPPARTIAAALAQIGRRIGPVVAQSRLWRTPAHPPGSGGDYVNAAAVVLSALPPAAILSALHAIEAEFGRLREARWGARSLDLDLLAVGDRILPDAATQTRWRDLPAADQARVAPEGLILPHPRLQDRGFVLVPLAEVAPHWRHPLTGQTVAGMLAALPPGAVAGIAPVTPGS